MAAIIGDFGKNSIGLNLYRINGTKEEIESAVQALKKIGCELWDEPYVLEKAYKQWSILVRIKIPEPQAETNDK